MSQFAGYVLPGAVFVAFGLKWTLDASSSSTSSTEMTNKYLNDMDMEMESSSRGGMGKKKKNGGRHVKSLRKCAFCCTWRNLPIEGLVKLLVTGIGICASVAAAYPSGLGQPLHYVGDVLYATVYLFFAISGLVDVLTFYCSHALPFGLNHFALAMAFTIEGLMFYLHLRHQAFMEQHVHILLVCAILTCAVVSLCQILMPYSQILKFARAFSSLVHGSWYIQSGFILYNPSRIAPTWSTSSDYNNALIWISLTFAWHCAGAFMCLLLILLISRRRRPSAPPGGPIPEHIEAFEQDHPGLPSPGTLHYTESTPHLTHCTFCSKHTIRSA